MELTLGTIISIVAMLGSAMATMVNFLYTQPLKVEIANLARAVNKLVETVEVNQKEMGEMRERIAKLESAVSSAHKRLDDALKRLDELTKK